MNVNRNGGFIGLLLRYWPLILAISGILTVVIINREKISAVEPQLYAVQQIDGQQNSRLDKLEVKADNIEKKFDSIDKKLDRIIESRLYR